MAKCGKSSKGWQHCNIIYSAWFVPALFGQGVRPWRLRTVVMAATVSPTTASICESERYPSTPIPYASVGFGDTTSPRLPRLPFDSLSQREPPCFPCDSVRSRKSRAKNTRVTSHTTREYGKGMGRARKKTNNGYLREPVLSVNKY